MSESGFIHFSRNKKTFNFLFHRREFGLERFVPSSLIDGMKRKELRRLIAHFLKLNAQMTGSSSKTLTQLQVRFNHYHYHRGYKIIHLLIQYHFRQKYITWILCLGYRVMVQSVLVQIPEAT